MSGMPQFYSPAMGWIQHAISAESAIGNLLSVGAESAIEKRMRAAFDRVAKLETKIVRKHSIDEGVQ